MNLAQIDEILRNINSTPDITSSAVISSDGLPIITAFQAGLDEDRIGAMAAALTSLCTRAAREALSGNLDHVIINTDSGYMLTFQATDAVLLNVTTTRDAKLGMVLFEAKRALKQIAAHFQD